MNVAAVKMHADEVHIDGSLVRRLIAAQFPDWAHLAIELVVSTGTDNAIYRLGDEMAVRLPRRQSSVGQVEKEHRWLPTLAPHLPLAIPVPIAKGKPAEGYPWRWSVYRWIQGENATIGRIADWREAALAIAEFIAAMRRIDPTGGPAPGAHNFGRGVPLAMRDANTRAAITSLDGVIDTQAATLAWEAALEAPAWNGAPVWIHGDLQTGNLLVERGRLSAVIDFGGLGVGDPACDLMVAWMLLPAEAREVFRAALSVDDAAWTRGRGWALSVALMQIPYYRHTNPVLAAGGRRAIAEVLAEHKHES